ncbi:hypothetical protein IGI04_038187, partial [Brassica rapa subsp. trilocularis]
KKKRKTEETNKQDRSFKTRAKAPTFNSNQQYEKDTKSNSRLWFITEAQYAYGVRNKKFSVKRIPCCCFLQMILIQN